MDKYEYRTSLIITTTLRDRIRTLGKLEGRSFIRQAVFMLDKAATEAERKMQATTAKQ
jgi:hypothetical protein